MLQNRVSAAQVTPVKGSALALGKINCWTGVPGTNEKDSMIVKGHSGLLNHKQ